VKARHVESGRTVALKRVWAAEAAAASHGDSGSSSPVLREIEMMSALDHENVVRLNRTVPLVRECFHVHCPAHTACEKAKLCRNPLTSVSHETAFALMKVQYS